MSTESLGFLHPDAIALGALPLALFVVDVALQFFHLYLTRLARHRS
jgi:hypothetical protein